MNQEQEQQQQRSPLDEKEDPIKFGDVFNVSGDLASKPIAPQDAAMMQTAENMVLGQTQKGGPAAVMQSAATRNERAGLVGHRDFTDVAGEQGVNVTETDSPGRRVITESVAGQVVREYVQPMPVEQTAVDVIQQRNKAVDQSDASAIQAAEVRATGVNVITPGGLASTAQSAAIYNARIHRDEDKIKLRDVLTGATSKLPADKAATPQDAEGVVNAELRNNPNQVTHPGGVAASVSAAARLNDNIND
uniref:Late embryogenisis abundant protein 12 n=1 Tax=Betula platyphylla TaxID=78630 RepID=A0A223FWJ9_BETPL|nr:late embryogenisis abundant protein 12 [Betula platyphylla]